MIELARAIARGDLELTESAIAGALFLVEAGNGLIGIARGLAGMG